MLILVLLVLGALSVSFTCSLLESSLLSSRLVHLRQRAEKGQRGASVLLQIKEKRLDDAISAILTYNTIAHTVGATLAGAQAAKLFGEAWVGLFSAVLTLMILVFTEIIPKTIGAVYAEQLAWPISLTIRLMMLPPMSWLLVVTRSMTKWIMRNKQRLMTRADLLASVDLATQEGTIKHHESRMFTHVLKSAGINVGDVMTPRPVVFMVAESLTVGEVLDFPESDVYSRIPVFREREDAVIGYVLVRELLRVAAKTEGSTHLIGEYVRPVPFVSDSLSVVDAFREFTRNHDHMGIVEDEFGSVGGVVTMEDLVETALGVEIVDELDEAVDLREVARDLRSHRLDRKRQERDKSQEPGNTQRRADEQDRSPLPGDGGDFEGLS